MEQKKKKEKPNVAEKLQYEEALTQLDKVVRQLEGGDGTLEEMIHLYEYGMQLITVCNERLDSYDARITQLSELKQEDEHEV
ncbi:MAG: exodeoxyribonuclease VII small subunit [Clostridia bacterium]